MAVDTKRARLIAFYLPQFHPIPENDEWWGKGFTEWTNVARAKPLFPGHYQPHVPADLGFYDLRVPETRLAQAEMARAYGIQGFCYWHYWFAGRRILERPFCEVLKSREPDFPFCLAWANQSWTGISHGAPRRVLIEQTYPGEADYTRHFYSLLEAFADERYLTVDNRKVFVVYQPDSLPHALLFADLWRGLASKHGLRGLYLIGMGSPTWNPQPHGFDAAIVGANPRGYWRRSELVRLGRSGRHRDSGNTPRADAIRGYADRIKQAISSRTREGLRIPRIQDYARFVEMTSPRRRYEDWEFPEVVPNWDNTPRSGLYGIVLHRSSPELFGKHLRDGLNLVKSRTHDGRIVFVKSWNEWAEGNHLEPDMRYGRAYLEIIRDALHA